VTGKDARRFDDGGHDPDNPEVPFRMSDRLDIYGLKLGQRWMIGIGLAILSLVGAGMAFKFL
jgi:hypothetical protein